MRRVAVNLVAIFCLVYIGVFFGYGRLKQEMRVARPAASRTQPVAGKKSDNSKAHVTAGSGGVSEDYQVIVRRNIFQAVLTTTTPAPKPVEKEVAPTQLNLTLLGTVTGNEQDARAIIVDNSKRQQDLYRVGDAVQNALIETIERGRVTLDVNGQSESLVIKDREGGGPQAPVYAPGRSISTTANGSASVGEKRKRPRVRPHRRISFRQSGEADTLEQKNEEIIVKKPLPEELPDDQENSVELDDPEEQPVAE